MSFRQRNRRKSRRSQSALSNRVTNRFRRLAFEPLEDRRMLSGTPLLPGAVYEGMPYELVYAEDGGSGSFQFNDANRWSTTATDGGGLGQGDITTLTWSFVPDGTEIAASSFDDNGGGAGPSDLISFLDGIRGAGPGGADLTQRPWFSVFQDSFDRLSAISGLTYVYEANDDGADHGTAAGSLGVRGDIRIGGRFIDGQPAGGSTLAYNAFPNDGDMVIDTGNISFYTTTTNNSLGFRNVIMHEAGHGVGLSHVLPVDQTKLMEPTITTAFDGPQIDDILALHRGYGDQLEEGLGNDSFANATSLGAIPSGAMILIGADAGPDAAVDPADIDFISIDDDSDFDYFEINVGAGTFLKVLLTPLGATYDQGPQGTDDDPPPLPTPFDTSAQSDLRFSILNSAGIVVANYDNNGIGEIESVEGFDASAGGTFFIRVAGADDAAQLYSLSIVTSDRFESNNSIADATVLGSVPYITLRDLSIDSSVDEDFFKITAHSTGKLIINAYFEDDLGDLDIQVLDASGDVIASATSTTDNEQIIIPVVGQQMYFLRVFGFNDAMNTYDLEIENFPAPIPSAVLLNPADDTGMMNNDNVTAETQPQFFIQVDLDDFEQMGIPIDPPVGSPGADVQVQLIGINTGAFVVGNATRVAGTLWTFTPAAPLVDDTYLVSAAVRITDGQTPNVSGNAQLSVPLWLTIDAEPGAAPAAPDLLESSDTGMLNNDNVTRIRTPAFHGVVTSNAKVRIYAQNIETGTNELVGQSTANADGTWEITIEPLDEGAYDMTIRVEDASGNLSDPSDALRIWIDTDVPNTPHMDLVIASDTGRHNADNVTFDNTPTFTLVGDDTVDGNGNPFPHDLKYRVYDRPGDGTGEVLIYDSFVALAGFTTLGEILFTSGVLADGVHNLKLEVEDRAGNISPDFLLEITVDTVVPPVSFGQPMLMADGLDPASDTGVLSTPETFNDRITSDTTPTLWGLAEANSIVRVYADVDGDGVITLGVDVLLGETVALPFDGNEAFADGYWELTSTVDLNNPSLFADRDGLRTLLVTANDLAGNFNDVGDDVGDANQVLDIFLDTQGPQIESITVTDSDYDVFDPKPSENGPTPLIHSIDVSFIDQPIRGLGGMMGAAPPIDVLLLFDDTGSFAGTAPTLVAAFPQLIAALEASLPGADLAFGVARFEEYGNFASEDPGGRPFILNHPILAFAHPNFNAAITGALGRTAPGFGGDGPESAIEALYQLATGLGFDGNGNGSTDESGAAGLVSTQTTPGSSGDVPAFASFMTDAGGPVVMSSGSLGGVGFRPGAVHLVLLATDIGFAYEPDAVNPYVGLNGVTVAAANLQGGGRGSTPGGRGAGIQETIDALLALDAGNGVRVIGLSNMTTAGTSPRLSLESLSILTGAINETAASIDSGIVGDPIDPGEPFFFQIDPNSGEAVANAIVAAITGVVETGGFLYPAVHEALFTNPGHFSVVGDHVGHVVIESIEFIDHTVSGDIGRTTIRIHFADPLPDDRFTITVSDSIMDDAGNALDGESSALEPSDDPEFPSGDGVPGSDFAARFTVDSRPEIGSFVAQSITIDINGNFVWDPANAQIGNDATNVDLTFTLPVANPDGSIGLGGYNVHDLLFAGKFVSIDFDDVHGGGSGVGGPVVRNLFDQLAAYGYSAEMGARRWIIDTNSDGVVNTADGDIISIQPNQSGFDVAGAIPLAGDFDFLMYGGGPSGGAFIDNGDEIVLYKLGQWIFDTDRDFVIETNGDDVRVYGTLYGHPIIGDFDGDGLDDLAVFNNNQFFFDLAFDGFGSADANGDRDAILTWGYPGVLDRPVAADMDQDGIDDIGLWVPRDSAALPRPIAEWFFLISDDHDETRRMTGEINTLNHPYETVPFGHDIYAEFGDELALPIVGNFDPPTGATPPDVQPNSFLPADFDGDGDVDGDDFLMWQSGDGDADGDGDSDGDDFLAWQSTYGTRSRASFDYGTNASPSETGYMSVIDSTAYNSARGYGWLSGTIRSVDRGIGSNVDRDLNYTHAGTFGADVMNGVYDVTIRVGDVGAYAHDRMAVYVEGAFYGEYSTAAGQVIDVIARGVHVTDGQLTLTLLDLGGSDYNAVMAGLRIEHEDGAGGGSFVDGGFSTLAAPSVAAAEGPRRIGTRELAADALFDRIGAEGGRSSNAALGGFILRPLGRTGASTTLLHAPSAKKTVADSVADDRRVDSLRDASSRRADAAIASLPRGKLLSFGWRGLR